MTDILINRLKFLTNAHTILKFIQRKPDCGGGPAQFSFNSLRWMPESLNMENTPSIQRLSLMNSDLSMFDEKVRAVIFSKLGLPINPKESESGIEKAISAIRAGFREQTPSDHHEADMSGFTKNDIFEQAVANYRQFKFFSHLDWRLAHWGTVEDVLSVVDTTFALPTTCIEFTTRWSPPIPAVQFLSDTFPSVRFELFYHYPQEEPWSKIEIFPTVPFGY